MHRFAGRAVTVREAFILTPEDAPVWAHDRAELWNRVEETETRKNSRVGREVQLGFAYELGHAEQKALVTEFAQREFVAKGFAVDVAIHNYGRTIPAMGGDTAQHDLIKGWASAGVPFLEGTEAKGIEQEHVMIMRDRAHQVTGYKHYQPHAHLRVTPRPVDAEGFRNGKAEGREFDKYETAMNWRYEWPKLQNAYLERAGSSVRVRSTGSDEDAYPGVPRLPESGKAETHAIELRRHELEGEVLEKHEAAKQAEEREQAFRSVHNDTIRQAFKDDHAETDDAGREAREQVRLAAWWRNVSQRFNQWRFDIREHADVWRERFEQQKGRLQSLLGWHAPEQGERFERSDGPASANPPELPERER